MRTSTGHGRLRAGDHPGGICLLRQPPLSVASDRLAVYAGNAGYLSLGCTALQQRQDRCALVGLQDIHSLAFPRGRPSSMCPANRCRRRQLLPPVPDQLRWVSLRWPSVGEFGWPPGGTATCCQMGLPRLRSRRVSVCKDWGAPNTMRAKSGWRGLMRMLRSAGTTALGTLNSAVWAP